MTDMDNTFFSSNLVEVNFVVNFFSTFNALTLHRSCILILESLVFGLSWPILKDIDISDLIPVSGLTLFHINLWE